MKVFLTGHLGRSAGYRGRRWSARDAKRCLDTVNNVVNGLPVIGHAKGVVHYIAGDTEGWKSGDERGESLHGCHRIWCRGRDHHWRSRGHSGRNCRRSSYDGTATLITDKPQGIIAACDNVIKIECRKYFRCPRSSGG
ncbi:unnamed protein product, partial [Mesorhabditis belari]|uniref:Uncharacterized protein n=1 Tax=Mesorhabditis belari TaxID=2138241 RepID=A0AAF3F5S8_9BILA